MIIQIVRDTKQSNMPSIFRVGEVPFSTKVNGTAIEAINYPQYGIVKSIDFQETGYDKGQVYRGKCYIVKFENENGTVSVIPAENIIDIAARIGSVQKDKKKTDIPALPDTVIDA